MPDGFVPTRPTPLLYLLSSLGSPLPPARDVIGAAAPKSRDGPQHSLLTPTDLLINKDVIILSASHPTLDTEYTTRLTSADFYIGVSQTARGPLLDV